MPERLSGGQAAQLLLDPLRTDPVLVLTIPKGAQRPLFNAPGLASRIGANGNVVEVEDEGTWALNRQLPEGARVFGGAARIYPPGTDWMTNASLAPRRLARDRAEAAQHEDALVSTMLGEEAPTWSTSTSDVADRGLVEELANANRKLSERDAELRELKQRLASERQSQQHQQQAAPEAPVVRLFADDVAQVRHEVYLAWAEAIPAESKDELPLPEYGVGDDLYASLEGLSPKLRRKALRRIALLLTGADVRDVHAMARSGGEPVTRADGAVLLRAYVEQKTASARRIHFWRLDGRIELSRVVLHDDFEA